jgi:prepilin-type N-terminal cleavage/methylation domain-containing protein
MSQVKYQLKQMSIKKIANSKKGFTLIEMMVSVGIFAIVMTISAGTLFAIMDANAKSQALKSVMNNLNLALEGMSRNIRVGSTYHCSDTSNIEVAEDCPFGSSIFAFEKTGGNPETALDQVVYRLRQGQIERSLDGGTSYSAITSPEVEIETLRFIVRGSSPEDNLQPSVVILVRGSAGIKAKIRTDFDIQTTVSQRLLDIIL